MPITWQNINIGNAGSANALLTAGSDQMLAGLGKLTDVAEDVGKQNTANYETIAGQNTADVLGKLKSITDIGALETELKSGGLNLETLDSKYGKQYDKSLIASTLEAKQKELMTTSMAKEDRALAKTRQAEKDLMDRESFDMSQDARKESIEAAKLGRQADLLRIKESQLRLNLAEVDTGLKMANLKYKADLDMFAPEALNTNSPEEAVETYKSKAYGFVEQSQGKFSRADADASIATFKNIAFSRGLDRGKVATDVATTKVASTQALDILTKEQNLIKQKYKEHYGYDQSVATAQADAMSEADASGYLIERLAKKGEGWKYDAHELPPIAETIRREFRSRNVEPSHKMVADIMISSGWNQEFLGLFGDSVPETDLRKIRKYVDKAAIVKDFALGAKAIDLAELEKTFTGQKAVLEKAGTEHLNALLQDAFKDSNNLKYGDGIIIDSTPVKPSEVSNSLKTLQEQLKDEEQRLLGSKEPEVLAAKLTNKQVTKGGRVQSAP